MIKTIYSDEKMPLK